VVAGVGHHERLLGARSTPYELWTPLRTLLVEEIGLSRLRKLWGTSLGSPEHRRFAAYVSQAETFYLSAESMRPESRPLLAYYFALNLTKAFLTCADPATTASRSSHGLSDAFDEKQRYWFIHEQTKVTQAGIFRHLATSTGMGFCYVKGTTLAVQKLAPYLVETADIYEDAVSENPRLVPLSSVDVWSDGSQVWLRVEVDRGELSRRGIGPASLPDRAALFGKQFKHVQSETPTASYESDAMTYGGKKISLRAAELRNVFDSSLIHSNRGVTGARHLVVISGRTQLLSQEAVSFAVFHHLSNMVRYRPEQVAKLAESKWFFLFSIWTPRAMENFLLAMTSRILKEEVRIE
jgi:YaaC-like Protein